MTESRSPLEEALNQYVSSQQELLERSCEEALQSGTMGVLVDEDGVRPSDEVPYGHIWRKGHPRMRFFVEGEDC